MRLPAVSALLLAALTALLATAAVARAESGDVLVQSGHEGRPASCTVFHVGNAKCKVGAAGSGQQEIRWTPIVANEATAVLRAHGLTVLRRKADYAGNDSARAAVFLHFDGAPACKSGASAGFPATTSRAFVTAWETRYRAFTGANVPFVGENISAAESGYYAYKKVIAPQKLLIEFGEISCPAQEAWMKPRLKAMGDQLAAFLIAALQKP